MISLYNLLFENTSMPQDLLDKEKKFLNKMDDLRDKLTNLNEDAKSDAILDRMEQLIRVMNKYKADGNLRL